MLTGREQESFWQFSAIEGTIERAKYDLYLLPLRFSESLGTMADDLTFDQVDYILGDVRGVVGDPLEVPGG